MFYEVEQNTPDWDKLRLGRFTASGFKNLFMSKTTKGYQGEIERVISEILSGEKDEDFQGGWIERGHKMEQEAKEWYQRENFVKVKDGGFWTLDNELAEWVGCSPDGIVESKIMEIKSLAGSNIIPILKTKELPKDFYWQVHGQLWITGKESCIFLAYHPKLPKVIIEVKRDELAIKELQEKLTSVVNETKEILSNL